jgi:hypothetical protein
VSGRRIDVRLNGENLGDGYLVPTRIDRHDDQALIEIDMTSLLLVALTVWIAVVPLTVVISALMYPYVLRPHRMSTTAAARSGSSVLKAGSRSR